MRMLLTFTGGSGHLGPLVPIAHAAQAAGHTVAIAGRPSLVDEIEALGFTAFAPESGSSELPSERIPLQPLDTERELRAMVQGFAASIARDRAPRVLELCEQWRPDVIVREEFDFGTAVAAERLGVPDATVLVSASGAFPRPAEIGEALQEVRADHGLAPDPGLGMLTRNLVIAPFPPSFRDPASPLPATALSIRQGPPATVAPHPVKTIYFTLGTVFNVESGDLFGRVLTGLRELPVNVVVTVGQQIDPAELGEQPDNVRVERHIPQAEVLATSDLVVCHGGSGSVIGALAHGLPLVVLPMGADQPFNAERCVALGVGRVVEAFTATAELVHDTAAMVLVNPGYARKAAAIRDEIAALPGPEDAVERIERLAEA